MVPHSGESTAAYNITEPCLHEAPNMNTLSIH